MRKSPCLTVLFVALLLTGGINILFLLTLVPWALVRGGLIVVLMLALAALLYETVGKKEKAEETACPGLRRLEWLLYGLSGVFFLVTYILAQNAL